MFCDLSSISLDLKMLIERVFLVKDSKYNGVKLFLDRFQRDGPDSKVVKCLC